MWGGFSKSTESELCKRLDPMVYAWNNRSLRERRYPFVLVDAVTCLQLAYYMIGHQYQGSAVEASQRSEVYEALHYPLVEVGMTGIPRCPARKLEENLD
jgi:hypothetical protein